MENEAVKLSDVFGQADALKANEDARAKAAKAWAKSQEASLQAPQTGLWNALLNGAREMKMDWNEIGTADHPSAFSEDVGEPRRMKVLTDMQSEARRPKAAGEKISPDVQEAWETLLNSGKY